MLYTIGVRTWLRFKEQVLNQVISCSSLTNFGASGPNNELNKHGCLTWGINFRCCGRLRYLKQVKDFGPGDL